MSDYLLAICERASSLFLGGRLASICYPPGFMLMLVIVPVYGL